ncbi:MAG TPA: glycoside hydrolase family 3 C-terminal domain-containing protein [Propionibacteriaceae bacterium]|nr:glycoside hydrolase family 3 C-terminal domain-containing protein [Propionibacteriaceae bacterium]
MSEAANDSIHRLSELTLEEKASLCLGSDFWHTAPVERLGIPRIMVSDGPHGLRAQLEEADHVGIGGSAPATCFPTASALGSSWNPELFRTVGEALGREAKKLGVSVVLGPGINMKRSPLCGRNFEYVSEDPWLAGELATAMVHGIQSQGIGTSLKHYAANNQEDDRLRVSAEVDERTLREIYLPAFERVVKLSQPWTVMCAYNKVNGIYCSEHHWLLTEVLREEWGFEGLVVSDWGAVHDRVAALKGGLDLEMPPNLGVSDAAIVAAVRDGSLYESILDDSVSRVLHLVDRSQPALREDASFDPDDHHALARRAAHESAVLLKNDGDVLPLEPVPGSMVAVIGEFARTPRYQGAGSSQVNPTRLDVALDELQSALAGRAEVRFAAGFGIGTTDDGEQQLLQEAVELASGADHVVVFLGLPGEDESEGFDRTHIDLPANQLVLLHALAEVHDRLIVILANGGVVRVSTWEDRVAAILECWLSGQAAGGAAVDLLLGVANPSGKLAETIPVRLHDNSSYLNFPGEEGIVQYGEGIFIGYRAYDTLIQPVSYPFGFGLSYTSFRIDDVDVSITGSVPDGDLAVTVTASVTNTGRRSGAEVVQVYVGDIEASVARPLRELKGFVKVHLEPGETQHVSCQLDERAFAFWSRRFQRWVVESGEFMIAVGSSSRDLVATETITLDAPRLALPLGPDSTLHEWLEDDRGRELISKRDMRLLQDPELIKVIGTMPMHTLAAFQGMALSHDELDELIAEL